MAHARELLTDEQKTSFFFIALPEALPIAVITRFINWFHEFGIPVGGVLVNMRIDASVVNAGTAAFVRNRLAAQDEHMRTIWQKFDGQVRAIAPLFEAEVRGIPMLRRFAETLFAT
jgi:arsenite-transporting ATPase